MATIRRGNESSIFLNATSALSDFRFPLFLSFVFSSFFALFFKWDN